MQTLNTANYGATLAQAAKHLAAFEPFHTGTLSAAWEPLGYTVSSYGVVIAYASHATGNGYIYPDAYTYSATTSKHANIVKKAWGLN